MPIRTEAFRPTLEEGNLVGNVYYTNYFQWPGRVLDNFLWSSQPAYMTERAIEGELLVTGCRVDYLREAMPFQQIEVGLAPEEVEDDRVTFAVSYWRLSDNERVKLATGRWDAEWVSRDPTGTLRRRPMPGWLRVRLSGH
jgi:acyl-CoA thioesterase FadM